MRNRRRRTRGVSAGTVITLLLTVLVTVGCVLLFPKLVGDIELRVDPESIGVAFRDSIDGLSATSTNAPANDAQDTAPATDLPVVMSTAAPSATQAKTVQTLSITAAGSISVDLQIQKACTGVDGYTFGPTFEQLTDSFTSDINLATLENLVVLNEKLTDVNMPEDALTAIRACGINTLCNGFYGALNVGLSGLTETLAAIKDAGMLPYGLFTSAENRNHMTLAVFGDTTVALLSFQSELSAAGKKKTDAEEQAYVIAPITLPTIASDITAARAAGAQIVIVSLCWGREGASAPSDTQKELAQGIANAGADIILGTHSGALQPIELLTANRANGTVHQTLCAYSLGNLLESDRSEREGISGALLHISLSYDLLADNLTFDLLTYTPTYVWRGKIDGKTGYRVLPSNSAPPDFMDEDQQKVMERCLKLVEDVLADSPVTQAQSGG
jgi:poly-gamma-glutamate capsule biosynthesis protein CapA/YwtB (metallophosphatase superfamily)